MKAKKRVLSLIMSLVLLLSVTGVVSATSEIGSGNVVPEKEYSLEEMLRYALEDELVAYAEYQLIIAEYGDVNPFSNIIKAEQNHIEMVTELYNSLGIEIPEVDPSSATVLPASLEDAIATGVQAEINNIAMYDMFLSQDLPDEVREVFVYLRDASKNHLEAFQKDRTGQNGSGKQNRGNNTQSSLGSNDANGNRGQGKGNSQRGEGQRVNEKEECLFE